MYHCMIDLETWGTRPGCAIRSIGACAFDPLSDMIGDRFYVNIDVDAANGDLHIDEKTIEWWAKQSLASRLAFDDPKPIPLAVAIGRFQQWYESSEIKYVWSHGEAFDIPVFEAACRAVGTKAPWDYRAGRDTRTMYWAAEFDPKGVPFVGIPHRADHDAVHQAECVQAAYQKMTSG